MFNNLISEMNKNCVTIADLSIDKELNLSYETIKSKFFGEIDWNRREMWLIKRKYFPEKTIEYLFE